MTWCHIKSRYVRGRRNVSSRKRQRWKEVKEDREKISGITDNLAKALVGQWERCFQTVTSCQLNLMQLMLSKPVLALYFFLHFQKTKGKSPNYMPFFTRSSKKEKKRKLYSLNSLITPKRKNLNLQHCKNLWDFEKPPHPPFPFTTTTTLTASPRSQKTWAPV